MITNFRGGDAWLVLL